MNQLENKISFQDRMKNFFGEKGSAALGLIILFIFMTFMSDRFLTFANLLNVARQASINGIIAVGMTYVIITKGIDLSAGALVALTGTVAAGLIVNMGLPIIVAIILTLVVGALVGAFTGVMVSKQNIPPFIVTLALMTILRGLSFVYTSGRPIYVSNELFRVIGRGYIGPIPIPVIIAIFIGIIGHIVLKKTKFGRHIYSVGGNEEAARLCGVNIDKTLIYVYTSAGFLTAISGIILASRLSTGSPNAGEGAELDAIAAVILGGTSFAGGIGSVSGTFIGVAIIGILGNGLNLLNVSSYNQMMVKGLVILLAVLVNNIKLKKQNISR
jgi:ribose transport system permease protein